MKRGRYPVRSTYIVWYWAPKPSTHVVLNQQNVTFCNYLITAHMLAYGSSNIVFISFIYIAAIITGGHTL